MSMSKKIISLFWGLFNDETDLRVRYHPSGQSPHLAICLILNFRLQKKTKWVPTSTIQNLISIGRQTRISSSSPSPTHQMHSSSLRRVVPAPRPPLPQLRHYWRPGCCRCFRLPCALAYPFSQQRRRFQFLSPCWDHTVGTYVSLPPSRLWSVVACLHRPPQQERQQKQKKNISYYSKRNPRFQKNETIVVISIDFLVWNWELKNRRVLSVCSDRRHRKRIC